MTGELKYRRQIAANGKAGDVIHTPGYFNKQTKNLMLCRF
ncbi:hypothetical protein Dm11a5_1275 [Dehalococcoides mccartyi]|uniref:Uncharacterized protein n=1 Tax=Dehalococcoides mccartyi TaxID=61435 RepID=A0A142VBW3_9CHLR|nr:hypothetical protein Dm11a5_1275 [Dehalococcoides mccartyi]AOV99883.1 hypothetical protein DCWBC2_1268 [Dehalococcoides mccartyi]